MVVGLVLSLIICLFFSFFAGYLYNKGGNSSFVVFSEIWSVILACGAVFVSLVLGMIMLANL